MVLAHPEVKPFEEPDKIADGVLLIPGRLIILLSVPYPIYCRVDVCYGILPVGSEIFTKVNESVMQFERSPRADMPGCADLC